MSSKTFTKKSLLRWDRIALYSDMHKHFIELGDHLVLYYNRGEPMNEGRRQEPDPGGDSLIYEKPRGTPNKLPYNTDWRFPE